MLFDILGDTNDDTSILHAFLTAGASATTKDEKLNQPLHVAAHCSFAEVLLKHGADIYAKNAQGQTPLYTACIHNRLNVEQLLLSHGSDVNEIVKDENWLSLMFRVTERNWCDYRWISSPRLPLVELLLLHGANVDAAAQDGSTVLHKAAQSSDPTLVRCLIERGAKVRATTAAGRTILHALCSDRNSWTLRGDDSGDIGIASVFLDLGVEPNARNDSGAPLCTV